MGATIPAEAERGDAAVPAGPALCDTGTSHRLARYRWVALLTGALGICVLALCVAHISREETKASRLLASGVRTHGTVVSHTPGLRGGESEMTVRYTADGRSHFGVIGELENSYTPGEEVTVIYDPRDPASIRTPEERNEPFYSESLLLAGSILGFCLILGGLITARRAMRWPRILATHPWRPYRLGDPTSRAERARGELTVTPMDDESAEASLLRLGATLRARSAKLKAEPVVWVAGDPAGQVIVARPGTRELFAGRLRAQARVRSTPHGCA